MLQGYRKWIGIARLPFVYTMHQHDPSFPDVPTLRELGGEDMEPAGLILVGPKGLRGGPAKYWDSD